MTPNNRINYLFTDTMQILPASQSQLTAFEQRAHFDDATMSKGMMGHVVRYCDPFLPSVILNHAIWFDTFYKHNLFLIVIYNL